MLNLIREAFRIRAVPLPWVKALNAGLCAGLPALLGTLFGNLQYGITAGLGGFTYLYVFNIPYAVRAKKLFFVMLGLSVSVFLGTLLSPSPLASAMILGMIGAFITFLFGAYKVRGRPAFSLCWYFSWPMRCRIANSTICLCSVRNLPGRCCFL